MMTTNSNQITAMANQPGSRHDHWLDGPVPQGTFYWGAVVLKDMPPHSFYFADFRGDHVMVLTDKWTRTELADIVKYTNCINVP